MATVVLVGTFDTRGAEYGWLREQLEAVGCTVTAVDVGSFSDGSPADVLSAHSSHFDQADVHALPLHGYVQKALTVMRQLG